MVKRKEKAKEKRCSVILSYNPVMNFGEGVYGDGRLIVVKTEIEEFDSENTSLGFFKQLVERICPMISCPIDKIYIYVGAINDENRKMMGEIYLNLAYQLTNGDMSKVTLVCCNCQRQEKEAVARQNDFNIIWCECGGESKLSNIAQSILKS